MGQLILIASGKGGAGKTTFAVNLASVFAAQGARALVLDLNQSLRNADIYMGLENEVIFDLGDVLSGVCRFDKALVEDNNSPGLFLLCCPQQRNIEDYARQRLPELYDKVRSEFDVVFIDGPAGAGDILPVVANGVNRALTIITPYYQALRNGDTVDRRLEELGVKKRSFAVNRMSPELFENPNVPSLEQMTRTMRCPLAGILNEDIAVHIANNTGTPCAGDKNSYLYEVFGNIALKI